MGPERAASALGLGSDADHGDRGAARGPGRAHRRLDTNSSGAYQGYGVPRCQIAPGPIGAAHQLAQSPGYAVDCEGTPAERSPYMWPLRWSAFVESKSLGFASDAPTYESRGRVWYMLDKNWKRLDTWFANGTQRSIGQSPCDDAEAEGQGFSLSCNRSSSSNRTMLHRNNRMVFIDWEGHIGGRVSKCSWLDLSIIGNVRPDWFMDDRGASTDVQYLGDSHVFYLGEPRLVKQWRKKDFANQYFTMSMQRLPGSDGVHWPLILNIPGEGFGDDHLQHWHGHRELDASEESEFLLDEAFEAGGGLCPKRASHGSGGGPPTGQQEHVPSNLEKDDASWRSVVYTGSPVWQPSASEEGGHGGGSRGGGGVPPVEVASGVAVRSCFDADESMLRISVNFTLEEQAWAAVAFPPPDDQCLMTPRGGGDGEMVWAQPGEDGSYTPRFGPLPASIRSMGRGPDPAAARSFFEGLVPLEDHANFSGGAAEHSNGRLVLSFARAYPERPISLALNFAHGATAAVGYHPGRGCFELKDIPACPAGLLCPRCPRCNFALGGDGASDRGSIDGATMAASLGLPTYAVLAILAALP